MECFTGSGGRSRLGASRRPFGDGSCYRLSQPLLPNPYGVLAFDEFTDEAKSLRCLSYLTNRDWAPRKTNFQGFAFLAVDGAHGNIASSLAISFASRVVEHLGTNTRASPILFSNYRQF